MGMGMRGLHRGYSRRNGTGQCVTPSVKQTQVLSKSSSSSPTAPPNGKYDTRYRSGGALETADPADLDHEHVYPRKWLIERMLETPEAVELILTKFASPAPSTPASTERWPLPNAANPNPEGWARYDAAVIRVIEMDTGVVVPRSIGEKPPPHALRDA